MLICLGYCQSRESLAVVPEPLISRTTEVVALLGVRAGSPVVVEGESKAANGLEMRRKAEHFKVHLSRERRRPLLEGHIYLTEGHELLKDCEERTLHMMVRRAYLQWVNYLETSQCLMLLWRMEHLAKLLRSLSIKEVSGLQ